MKIVSWLPKSVFIALLIVSVSFSVFGQTCSNTTQLSAKERFLSIQISNLLGNVSKALNAVTAPQTPSYIDDIGSYYIPQKGVILTAYVIDGSDVAVLKDNIQETLRRVGDLAFSLLGDKKLFILVQNEYGVGDQYYGLFTIDKRSLASANFMYRAFGTSEQGALNRLKLFSGLLEASLPKDAVFLQTYYVPGVGGYVRVSIHFDAPKEIQAWTCNDWRDYASKTLSRISDVLYASFQNDERLVLDINNTSSFPGWEAFFVISKDTANDPSTWKIYSFSQR